MNNCYKGLGTNKSGWIAAHDDLIRIYEIRPNGWVKGDYPAGSSRPIRWFKFGDLVMNGNFQNYTANINRSTAPVYRTYNSGSTIGSVYNNESVTVVDECGNRKCIVYRLSNGSGYKMGWVDKSCFGNVASGSYNWPTTSTRITARSVYPSSGAAHKGGLPSRYCANSFSQNNCIDIGVSVGNSVYAVANGNVIVSTNWNDGYGEFIVLEHADGSHSLYGHLSERWYPVGYSVTKGTIIGKSGQTGNSKGAHLHFGFDKFTNINDFTAMFGL